MTFNHLAVLKSLETLKFINKPMKPGRKTINEWLKMVVENQFTIGEIETGIAYKTFQGQMV